jgi:hypothetical protein
MSSVNGTIIRGWELVLRRTYTGSMIKTLISRGVVYNYYG